MDRQALLQILCDMNRSFFLLSCVFCALLIVLLSGCVSAGTKPLTGDAQSTFAEPAEEYGYSNDDGGVPMTVLCYGDSNTYGYDPRSYFGERYPADSRWVDILSEKTGLKTVNAGENGREIPRGDAEFRRFQELFAESQANCLIVLLGGNDLLQGASPETVSNRMETFLSQIADMDKSHIILVGPPAMELGAWVPDESLIHDSRELCAAYERLAEKMGIRFVNACDWDIDLCFDGVHFTENGHKAFAEGMAEFFAAHQID